MKKSIVLTIIIAILLTSINVMAAEPGVLWLEKEYYFIDDFIDGLARVYIDGNYGFIDKTGREVIPVMYGYVSTFEDNLSGVELNGKYGYIDKTGKEIIPIKYDRLSYFTEGLARAELNNKCGFIDKTGKEVIPFKYDYDENMYFSEGISLVYLNNKYGYIDETGKDITPIKYDYAFPFKDGLGKVQVDGKYGFIDKRGKEIIPIEYDRVWSFKDGLAKVQIGDNYGFIDKTGRKITSLKYGYNYHGNVYSNIGSGEYVEPINDGMILVDIDGKYGYIDYAGNEIVPLIYDIAKPFEDGLAIVAQDIGFFDYNYGIIDKAGKEVVPIKYEWIYPISDGIFAVEDENGKYGYLDRTGKEITPIKYDKVWAFNDGLGKVMLNNKYGYVDKTGKEVIPLIFDYMPGTVNIETTDYTYENTTLFKEGLAVVGVGGWHEWGYFEGKYGYIDKAGKEIIPAKYDYASSFNDGVAIVKLNNQWGIIENPLQKQEDLELEAIPTSAKVLVNGKEVSFEAYNIKGNNYFKLRDLASVLSGTEKQFEVVWDGSKKAINLISNQAYTAVGGEMAKGDGLTKIAKLNTAVIYKDGVQLELIAYNINGNNYFKLRDIGEVFDFGVFWDGTTKTINIDTSTGYVPE